MLSFSGSIIGILFWIIYSPIRLFRLKKTNKHIFIITTFNLLFYILFVYLFKSFVSIGLGCDVRYSKDITYADGINFQNKKVETPIGISCRICPRTDCEQRAFPPIDKELKLDIIQRGTSPYITMKK